MAWSDAMSWELNEKREASVDQMQPSQSEMEGEVVVALSLLED